MREYGEQIIKGLQTLNDKLRRGDLIEATRVVRREDGTFVRERGVLDDGEFEPFDQQ